MSQLSDNDHDLEHHLEQLKKLDKVRKRCAELRDEGMDVLLENLVPPDNSNDFLCSKERRLEISLILRALLVFHNQSHRDGTKESKRVKLVNALLTQLYEKFDLEELVGHELSVLLAASMLRTLTALPKAACSKTCMLCYYWIVLEIYTADSGDWQIGGARAAPGPGGVVTAYTTGECVRALWSFHQTIRNTGEFIGIIGNYLERIEQLEKLDNYFFKGSNDEPLKHWVEQEKKRLQGSSILSLQKLAHYHLFPLYFLNEEHPEETIKNYLDMLTKGYVFRRVSVSNEDKLHSTVQKFQLEFESKKKVCPVLIVDSTSTPNEWTIAGFNDEGEFKKDSINDNGNELAEELLNKSPNESKIIELVTSKLGITLKKVIFIDDFREDVQIVLTEYSDAIKEIEAYRNNLDFEDNETIRSLSAHQVALKAVQDAKTRLEKVKEFSGRSNSHVLNEIEQWFYETAEEIKKLLLPVKIYLSSVLDRELALISRGEEWDWKSGELSCAAASYRRLIDTNNNEIRFHLAADELSRVISSRGTFASHQHIHDIRAGGKIMLSNTVILHSLSQLLCYAYDKEIDADLINKMLNFFEDTRAKRPLDTLKFSAGDISECLVIKLKSASVLAGLIKEKSEEMQKILHEIPEEIVSLPKSVVQAIKAEIATALNNLIVAEPLNPILKTSESFEQIENSEFAKIINDEDLIEKLKKNDRIKKLLEKSRVDDKQICEVNKLFLQIVFAKQMPWFTVAQNRSDKKGWGEEFSLPPIKTSLIGTVGTVIALAEMNTMLDEQINRIIFDHFSVKKTGEGLKEGLTLDTLFYTDYGMDLADAGIQQQSVAISLQQMHAHINRLILPDEINESLCSIVLHGPPGTGKTTLVEALAVTSGVPLVEVTPSDLVKGGQENVERRARAVFYALSLLTRTVILFDEFDPVLRRREVSNNNPLNVFSFLTPGMLPKLKDLHDRAEERSVVYFLITNHIGSLDEAAVRRGRFDERIGIYPPDLLSRTGRLLDQFYTYQKPSKDEEALINWKGLGYVINKSAGLGMTTLGKPGWFTCPKGDAKNKTPFKLLMAEENEIEWPEPEFELKEISGKGPIASKEFSQWDRIQLWDNAFDDKETKEKTKQAISDALDKNRFN